MKATQTLRHATVVALVTWAGWAYAAEEQPFRQDESASAAAQSSKESSSERDRSRTRLEELDRCKQQAQGLKGPERARFMTECLAGDRLEK